MDKSRRGGEEVDNVRHTQPTEWLRLQARSLMDFALIDKAISCRLLRSVHFVVQTRSLEQKEDGIELLWLPSANVNG